MVDAAWIALSLTERVGGKTLTALMDHFHHDPKAILAASERDLRAVPGVGPKIAQSIRTIDLQVIEEALPSWEQKGVRVVTFHDAEYPPRLRQLGDAPPTLFLRGNGMLKFAKSAAIVGRRHPSQEARQLAQNLSSQLAERDYVIVSGMAYGIDAAAHMGAIAVNGCTTAVLGCGLLNLYPPEHEALAEAMMRHGVLVSELHPARGVSASNLVARNRIITGLSDVVVVVETEVDGGAMYAAKFAAAQGRVVYVVESAASGNRALIKGGAVAIPADLSRLPFEV